MAKIERTRDEVHGPLSPEYLKRKAEEGWQLVAVEWARESEGSESEFGLWADYVPYGLRVAGDCLHLEEDSGEMRILSRMMELIVADHPLSRVAEELNREGYRTRQGWKWGQVSVFNMLPRLIEVGPRIFTSEEWVERRRHLFRVTD